MDTITVETSLLTPVHQVWESWTNPKHIKQWNFTSPNWKCSKVIQQLEPSGEFSFKREAKDGSKSYEFSGVYEIVIPKEEIVYLLDDGRKVNILFDVEGDETYITQTFEADEEAPLEDQEKDWQTILDNFKKHTEAYFK
ncbi:SRPBCC domain-containing protein [Mesonia aestuariivivens]|uniref:SRPBCC domain-containing protein n=1 Tax=Mesonia aestuariivivens TaxID=2796128 RepID=A0ABS6VYT3_9FLAO|nr:SRPBCC domain-containing protein [Mesonia aestuariivivens]MBW2960743.1 SRPBCC domain-containing protein [Mesonia aestuariivivens]